MPTVVDGRHRLENVAPGSVPCTSLSKTASEPCVRASEVLLRPQMAPAGDRSESELVERGEAVAQGVLAANTREPLLMAVEPDAGAGLTAEECVRAVSAGPVAELGHQPFLAAVRKQVAQPADLRFLFVADRDGLVAALQQRPAPAMEPPGLLREVGIDVAAEASELAGVLGRHQRMPVIALALAVAWELFMAWPWASSW